MCKQFFDYRQNYYEVNLLLNWYDVFLNFERNFIISCFMFFLNHIVQRFLSYLSYQMFLLKKFINHPQHFRHFKLCQGRPCIFFIFFIPVVNYQIIQTIKVSAKNKNFYLSDLMNLKILFQGKLICRNKSYIIKKPIFKLYFDNN